MTWRKLTELAERNRMSAEVADEHWQEGETCWAYLVVKDCPPRTLEASGKSPRGAKRALCRAVERIREAQ